MPNPTLQAEGATIANTTGSLTVVLASHQTDDILILCLIAWVPNTTGDAAAIPTPSGWAEIAQLQVPAAGEINGRIAWFWKRAASGAETNPVCARGASWDTGNDTCFGGRAYTVRGCLKTGTPWDEADPTAIYTAANQAFDAVTVSGPERTVIQFGCALDNAAFAMTATGWTTGTEDNDGTGTDCAFQTARKENVSSSTGADAATVSAPAQGAYAFLGISFIPQVLNVSPSSIPSEEAFGSVKVNLRLLGVGAIATAEAHGATTVNAPGGGQSITDVGGIASAEAFGSAGVNLKLALSGIASAEAFGSSQVNHTVSTTGIASAEAFGTLRLIATIAPTGIPSSETFGTPSVHLKISTVSIGSAEAFGTPGIIQWVAGVGGIASQEQFGTLALHFKISATGIPSAEAFGTLKLNRQVVTLSIASAEAFGVPQLNLIVRLMGIPSAEAFGTAQLNRRIIVVSIASGEAFGIPEISVTDPGTISGVGSIASSETFGIPTLTIVGGAWLVKRTLLDGSVVQVPINYPIVNVQVRTRLTRREISTWRIRNYILSASFHDLEERRRNLSIHLLLEDGSPVNLEDAVVHLVLENYDFTEVLRAPAQVLNAAAGFVRYWYRPGDIPKEVRYTAKRKKLGQWLAGHFRVDWPDETFLEWPLDRRFEVRIH